MNRAQRRHKPKNTKKMPTIFLGQVRPRSPGLSHSLGQDSMLELIARSSGVCGIRPVRCDTGPLLSKARNLLLEQFLETQDDYFLFVDTDIVYSFEDLQALMEVNKPIAGSVYFTLDGQENLVCTALDADPDDASTYRDVTLSRLSQEEPDAEGLRTPTEPFVVSGLGMGFTLIQRKVIEALADAKGGIKRLWPYAETDEERGYGEDLTFCLRAAELGFESWLVPASKVGHIKEIIL